MNRTTSLFLAVGILLAHALAIHQTDTGGYAGSLDDAHVAFRLARQLFRDGIASWNSGVPSFDAYPSPLWILVSWLPERLYFNPSRFCQLVSLACAFSTALVVSRFSRDRLAGIIAPFLLVMSGSFASAASSGTEITMLALAMTLSFLSLERRRPRMLAASLCLTAITRPEGAYIAVVIWLLSWTLELGEQKEKARTLKLSILPAAFVLLALLVMRNSMTGLWLSPTSAAMGELDTERIALGSSYLSDFILKSGSGLLILFPAVLLLVKKLNGMAARGFALVLAWFIIIAWSGGNDAPFWLAMAPILPIMCVTIQEAMTVTIDSERRGFASFAWVAFVLALALSAMVSKKPGNLGFIPLAETHFEALGASPRVSEAYTHIYGRDSARIAIRRSERLREIGFFLFKELDEEFNVVTPWPGSIGYHSRREVFDLLGRTSVAPGQTRLLPWNGRTKIDLPMQLQESPDHLLLSFRHYRKLPSARALLSEWLETWDIVGDTPERRTELIEHLSQYSLVTIPIRYRGNDSVLGRLAPFFLLRRSDAGLEPRLEIEELSSGEHRITMVHSSYVLLADLDVIAIDASGAEWHLRPTGELTLQPDVLTRTDLLLFRSETRSIELIRFELPGDLEIVELVATLRNPETEKGFPLSQLGEEARLAVNAGD